LSGMVGWDLIRSILPSLMNNNWVRDKAEMEKSWGCLKSTHNQ
jgi:hypothetical protein